MLIERAEDSGARSMLLAPGWKISSRGRGYLQLAQENSPAHRLLVRERSARFMQCRTPAGCPQPSSPVRSFESPGTMRRMPAELAVGPRRSLESLSSELEDADCRCVSYSLLHAIIDF